MRTNKNLMNLIISICNLYPNYGDFNCTLLNSGRRSLLFNEFLDCTYSFINSMGDRSLIDHFCVSENLINFICNYEIISDGDNI